MLRRLYNRPAPAMIPYFVHPKLRITIVVGDDFDRLDPRSRNEVFLVRDPWYPGDPVKHTARQRYLLNPNPRHLHFLSNTQELHAVRLAQGYRSHYINIGCFINEAVFCPGAEVLPKRFDAVINSRFALLFGQEIKHHDLTGKLQRLALLDPMIASDAQHLKAKYTQRPNCEFHNTRRLPPQEVAAILRQSHCGLILSSHEGVCRASSEYLLTGLPVVSTRSVGGRDIWYDSYNATIVEPTEEAVYAAVEEFKAHPRDPQKIRMDYLARAQVFRDRFRDDVLRPILAEYGVEEDAGAVMAKCPFRWWPDDVL